MQNPAMLKPVLQEPLPMPIEQWRIIHWIKMAGGEITQNRLRRYRPKKAAWRPIERALRELIAAGVVVKFRNETESLERTRTGYPGGRIATRYRLTQTA